MTITREGNEIVIRLTIPEAKAGGVNHGESEIYIPVRDSLSALLEMQDALGMRGKRDG